MKQIENNYASFVIKSEKIKYFSNQTNTLMDDPILQAILYMENVIELFGPFMGWESNNIARDYLLCVKRIREQLFSTSFF